MAKPAKLPIPPRRPMFADKTTTTPATDTDKYGVVVSFRLPPDLVAQLEAPGQSFGQVAREIVIKALRRKGRK